MYSSGFGAMYDSLGSGPGPAPKARKERRLSLLFRRSAEPMHCAGIESLVLDSATDSLYTASRDATLRRWNVAGAAQGSEWVATYEGHSNWVNDAVLVQDVLVSCSSDCTVSLWKAAARGVTKSLCTLHNHADYITCLAAAEDQPIVASAGLRGQVQLWDLAQTMKNVSQGLAFKCVEQPSTLGSVYALDLNARGNVVAVGSPEGLIRISDARTGAKAFKLRGHTDNVRAVLMNQEGTLLLSASSDHTIRLWDLGQQRYVQTLAVHSDSVWSLQASSDFSTVYSGGRDHCVYRTHLPSRSSELLFEEQAPVTRLAMDADSGRAIWSATTESSVRRWNVPPADWGGAGGAPPPSPRTARGHGRIFQAGPSPQVRQRQRFTSGSRPEPLEVRPQVEIAGIPPIVRFAVLTDRRHVLTQDSLGLVALWDIICGSIVEQYGKVDMTQKERELFRPASVAPWFSADVKLGSLAIHLERSYCFSAEVYAQELGQEDLPDDLKYNYGEHMLKAALAAWVKGLAKAWVNSGPAGMPALSTNGAGPAELANAESCFQFESSVAPLLIGQMQPEGPNQEARPWTKAIDMLDGSEKVGEMIPKWVADAVLHHRYPVPPGLKCAFVLLPAEGSGLPSLLQSRLNAPRILRIHKVAAYIIGRLAEDGVHLDAHVTYYDPAWQRDLEDSQRRESTNGDASPEKQELELICGGVAVPYDLSLAAVRAFIWRRSDDLLLHFRIYNPKKPAPPPSIKPP